MRTRTQFICCSHWTSKKNLFFLNNRLRISHQARPNKIHIESALPTTWTSIIHLMEKLAFTMTLPRRRRRLFLLQFLRFTRQHQAIPPSILSRWPSSAMHKTVQQPPNALAKSSTSGLKCLLWHHSLQTLSSSWQWAKMLVEFQLSNSLQSILRQTQSLYKFKLRHLNHR